MDDLPDNVIPFTTLKIRYDKKKRCTCHDRKFEIDVKNRETTCKECGAIIDPYDALYDIAMHYTRINDEVKMLLEQRRQIVNYKPHLLAIKELERIYRSKDMIPCCPHCHRGIEAADLLKEGVNRQYDAERRKFEQKKGEK